MSRFSATVSTLRRLLAPLSGVYATAIRLRNRRYDRSPAASCSAGVPVVSIGNITVGGTGKTPLVIETVRRLVRMDRRPAILTRGYGARAGAPADEVLEFHEALPDVPVVVDPDRVAGAARARREHGADCLVLDDGFQHRRLRRDLDVVLIDALDPWGGGFVLPAGRLREPLTGLRRANLLVITRANQAEPSTVARIRRLLADRVPDVPVLSAEVRPAEWTLADGTRCAPAELGYHSVLPVCGLGNPATFLRVVEELAGRVCPPRVFRDHQRYSRRQVAGLVRLARRIGADLVVTTRKDWVKLAPLWPADDAGALPQLARLDVRLELTDDEGVFDECLARAMEAQE